MAEVLSEEGARLLAFLQARFPRIHIGDLNSFPTYRGVHEALALEQIGKTWGDSLDLQGMANLAHWALDRGYPAVTGLIVDKSEKRPGGGYFDLYGKDALGDGQWWLDQVQAALKYPWSVSPVSGARPSRVAGASAPMTKDSPARRLGDLLKPESRIFLKSEWGPVSLHWPALSFSKRSVGDFLNQEYRPGRDLIVYAGTGNAERTKEEDYRKRFLSVLSVETGQPLATKQLVPWESWQRELREHGKVWPLSFGVLHAWSCEDLPWAHDIAPAAYRALGFRSNWGGVVEVESFEEKRALAGLSILKVDLPSMDRLRKVSGERDRLREIISNPVLNRALTRMEALIRGRLGSGQTLTRQLSPRVLPAGTNLYMLLDMKLRAQGGLCLLCGRGLSLETNRKLLQCSPDRIDSSNPSYGEENLQITHLACNLAKNDGSASDFEEWLQLIR